MKKAIFITVRSDSTRLPQKAYKKILGRSTIELVMLRAMKVTKADSIVVCTTEREIDNQIIEIAQRVGVDYFRGSLDDKLARWEGAAKKYNIDYFATFDGDDLLCDPELVDLGLEQVEKGDYDFLKAPGNLAVGAFTYCINVKALQRVCSIKDTDDTEMMWTYFEDTGLFRVGMLEVNNLIFLNENVRLTLDYEDDFLFFKTVFEHFNNVNNDIPLKTIMEYLNQHPEIVAINADKQKEWKANQEKKTKLILKKEVF